MIERILLAVGGGSIARTLTLVISLTAALVVALACAAILVYDAVSARKDFAHDLETSAAVVAHNCAAAIVFKDAAAARRVLSALASDPDQVEAAVFPVDGSRLATWTRDAGRPTPALGPDGSREVGGLLVVYRPIVFDDERIGTIYVARSLDGLTQRLKRFLIATLIVLASALFAALAVSARAQRLVSKPILELASAARRVSTLQDYSIRVPSRSGDELGALTDSFNDMLAQIHARDAERKRAAEALQASEERFRQIAETIDEVFWLSDAARERFFYVSPAYERVWGRPRASLSASPDDWFGAVHPDDRTRVVEAVRSNGTGPYDEEFRIIRPGGDVRWIRERALPVRDAAGGPIRVAGVAEDVTDRRQLEAQLRQAQKLEAIGTLAGGIAHDFNNILGAILGYAELALMDVRAGNHREVATNVNEIARASERARDLVQQILAFSRQQEQARTYLDLAAVVSEATRLLRASLPPSIDVRLDFDRATPHVFADPTQIHQVVMNLGTNAWHAMPDGGTLTFSLRRIEADAALAQAHVDLAVGGYVVLSVRDTGCGMDQATRDRIFEPFFTTKEPGKGTGLGLSTIHGIVKCLGGAIVVESEPGRGTAFHLYFPAPDGRGAAVSEAREEDLVRGDGEHVLLVDDERTLVEWGRQALERLGYRVTGCDSPLAALTLFRDAPHRFDLVMTDFAMAEINGLEFVERVKDVQPDIPVVLTTGNAEMLPDAALEAFGVAELLRKPNTLKNLGDAVHRALAHRKAA